MATFQLGAQRFHSGSLLVSVSGGGGGGFIARNEVWIPEASCPGRVKRKLPWRQEPKP